MKKLPPLDKEARYYDIVQKGVQLLADVQAYKQSNLVKKMAMLNRSVAPSTFSNIVNHKRVSLQVLKNVADGIHHIIRQELGMEYSKDLQQYIKANDSTWQAYTVPEEPDNPFQETGLVLHLDGRLSIEQKTDFISTAQKEVIEVGIRLKTFSDYFTSRKDLEYKEYIIRLLKRGVTFKGYMLDPDSNITSMYFNDRMSAQESEADAVPEMKKVVQKLNRLVKEFEQQKYPGAFEIYLYKHVPYNHFLVVDQHLDGAKMMVSHYIYGIRRAECPVLEFTKLKQPALFQKYARSLQLFLQEAKRLQ